MPSNCALSGFCTSTMPPFATMYFRPSVPSEPLPESTTPMARSFWSSPSDRKKWSIGRRRPRGSGGTSKRSTPFSSVA
jgi:hypothetical protein